MDSPFRLDERGIVDSGVVFSWIDQLCRDVIDRIGGSGLFIDRALVGRAVYGCSQGTARVDVSLLSAGGWSLRCLVRSEDGTQNTMEDDEFPDLRALVLWVRSFVENMSATAVLEDGSGYLELEILDSLRALIAEKLVLDGSVAVESFQEIELLISIMDTRYNQRNDAQ